MKSKKQLVFVSTIILSMAMGAKANAFDLKPLENFYVNSKANLIEGTKLSLGYRLLSLDSFMRNARLEQQVTRSISVYDDQSYGMTKIMSNVMYDFSKHAGLTPYIGAGVGITRTTSFDENNQNSETTPSYQLLTGMTYASPKHPNLKLQLGYSYSDKVNGSENINDIRQKLNGLSQESNHYVAGTIKFNF